MARYIGVDLHRNCFTVCTLAENGRNYLKQWKSDEICRFAKSLRHTDEVAVEVTGNTRLFRDAIVNNVACVVVVNPRQFKVISQSVKRPIRTTQRIWRYFYQKVCCRRFA